MKSKWNEITATQGESDASYAALVIVYAYITKQIDGKRASDLLIIDCGVCSQYLLDKDGKDVALRILSDLTKDVNIHEDFEFRREP
jgi:hypothetical protein